ncbi:DUF3231 family protein [Alteribacillus sp. YIM 98480]|uniref:DUF3231 family protein n=1 Tax=Alteribacillus sp. YIM 98480 TaxID=2606599 RepID=UPI001E632CB3|nr:DUF3231 family protein [Alteribacillus sp. YIM 98480]
MEKNESQEETDIKRTMKEHYLNKKLVSSELGDLFSNYLGDSLFCCVYEHHLQVVQDDEIKKFIEFALNISKKHLRAIEEIFTKEKIPIPVGFGEQDIRKEAPRLFSDVFMVFYITEMARAGFETYGSALSTSFRNDIIEYFETGLNDTISTYKQGINLLLSKGIDISHPEIPYPNKVDFIEKESFISVIAGKTRPLTALEIKQLQLNLNTNTLGKALMIAFSQIASSEELRSYFQEGSQLAEKQITELGQILLKDMLPSPKIVDSHVTDSTISPFSDKLLLYHTVLSNGVGIQNYGSAMSKILRHDVHLAFASLSVGIGKYVNTGTNLMIKQGWLEEPPTSADREKLAKNHSSK